MTEDIRLYYIWLTLAFGAASKLAVKLLNAAGSPVRIFQNKLEDVSEDGVLTPKELARARELVKKAPFYEAERILDSCFGRGIDVLIPGSPLYPTSLLELEDYPLTLYIRGTMPDCNKNMSTAVVGTRTMSDYGRNMAYSVGMGLAYGGSIVVSGMALGTDSMALIGALESDGQVVAVLGSGVDVVYPREHRDIYRRIIERGAVISEYQPGTPPLGRNFPVRNRIMSGIANATVVIEADARSGALITAAHALDQGKKVFAVPGKIGDHGAEGTNNLIREGAITVLTAEDILAEYEFMYPHSVSVQRAHAFLKNKDMDTLSRSAMTRSRINSRTESGTLGTASYYGSGSYGGRRSDRPEAAAPLQTQPAVSTNEATAVVDNGTQTAVPKEKPVERSARAVNIVKSLFDSEKKGSPRKNDRSGEKADEKVVPAKKIELDMLDKTEIKVYNKMKPGVPTLPDELVDGETSVGTVLGALTMLEMAGAVESGSGGYFQRVQPDDIMQSEND